MASEISFGDANSGLQIGINHGQVSTTFHQHAAPERAETPPNPTIVIPFSRDKDFIRRDAIFEQVQRLCAEPGSRIALVGLGGVGKSQIAIEYAYQVRDRSPETWVFWVHASNVTRFTQSLREVAHQVKIPGWQDPRCDICQIMCSWLRSEKSGKWFIILDNVDEARFLLETPNNHQDGRPSSTDDAPLAPLISYLPHCQHGSILTTTRSKSVARRLVESCDIVTIEPMSRVEAFALMGKKLGRLGEHEDVETVAALAVALEYMPLAIVQATSYISQRAPCFSIRRYLETLQQSDQQKVDLLDYEGGRLRRDRESNNSIIFTWQISFDHIRETRPSAANLLALMSFCDRQGIPQSLLHGSDKSEVDSILHQGNDINIPDDGKHSTGNEYNEYNESVDDESADDNPDSISNSRGTIEEDILVLRDHSFISINGDGTTYEMHHLVQLSMRKWLKAQGQEERWKQTFISRLCAQLPIGQYENWEICQVYLPHAKAAVGQRPRNDEASLTEWASIMYKAASYLCMTGQGNEAQKMADDAMTTRIKLLGRTHEESLRAMTMVGLVNILQGRWAAAEKLQVEVIEVSKAELGADHPDVLTSMCNLAETYRYQGRFDVAEKLLADIIEMSKARLGADHPGTLTSMSNLASTYRNQGRWDVAEKLEAKVVETSKAKRGADHPNTLISMGNLAVTYWYQGRWDAAEKLNIEVMEANKAKLGADNPYTLTIMGNLAEVYQSQGRWDAAEKLSIKVMETRKTKLGTYHPDTMTSMSNLADIYRNQGQWEAAEKLNTEVMETRMAKLGADHPSTLNSMHNLSFAWHGSGKHAEAISLMKLCLQSRIRIQGSEHPYTFASAYAISEWEASLGIEDLSIDD